MNFKIIFSGNLCKAALIGMALFLFNTAAAQERKDKRLHFRLGFAPVLSFYSVNPKHTSGAHSKAAYCLSARTEIRLNKKLAFITGIEYLIHGLTFNSYYIQDRSTFIFDKNFDYKYSLLVNELNLPLELRFIPKSEIKKHVSPYICFGYMLRYIAGSNLQVESATDGVEKFNNSSKLNFEHPFPFPNGSSYLTVSPGIQKNFLNTHRALFVELNFRYAPTRFQVYESFMASGIFVKHYHIALMLGYKF
ncbi:MAG: outer membrane beta-barrel protein [Bacteroidia bacterium]